MLLRSDFRVRPRKNDDFPFIILSVPELFLDLAHELPEFWSKMTAESQLQGADFEFANRPGPTYRGGRREVGASFPLKTFKNIWKTLELNTVVIFFP